MSRHKALTLVPGAPVLLVPTKAGGYKPGDTPDGYEPVFVLRDRGPLAITQSVSKERGLRLTHKLTGFIVTCGGSLDSLDALADQLVHLDWTSSNALDYPRDCEAAVITRAWRAAMVIAA